jgi:uncharacterized protein (DUF362 family)
MNRREFIKKGLQASGLAAVTGIGGFYFHNRESSNYQQIFSGQLDFEVPVDPTLPKITLAENENHKAALNSALDGIGGIERFIKPGERVTIKPNVGWDRTPEQAANTNPDLVAEMVRLCLSAGASEVIVTDVTCNEARRCFLRSGIRSAAEEAGARVVLPVDEDFIKANMRGQLLTVWPVLKYFIETDRLINMPVTKHHSLTSCTLGMKNLYGILGGRRNQLHQAIDQSIVDLVIFCKPTLTVIDATRVLMRGGPQGGSINDVEIKNTVICSTDQVAADARASEFLGLLPERVSHFALAEKNGLGQINYHAAGFKEIT